MHHFLLILFHFLAYFKNVFLSLVNRGIFLTDNITGSIVKLLSDTRWKSRINYVEIVRFQIENIYNTLITFSEI